MEKSYLSRITFDPTLLVGPVASWVKNIRLVLLGMFAVAFLGILSYINLPRRLNPEIKIPILTIVTALPGASPEDVESLVTEPLENKLNGLSGLDVLSSVSRENVSFISLQFFSTVSQDKAKQDVQSAVSGVSNLPKDATTPTVRALDFEDRPIWTFAVTTDLDTASLMRFTEVLKKRIETISKVDRVLVSGFEDHEVVVSFTPEKIREYGISALQLAGLIKSSTAAIPSGTVTDGTYMFALGVDPTVETVEDLRSVRLTVSGTTVRLGDIATVMERGKSGNRSSYIATPNNVGKRTVSMSVYKLQSANIDEAEKAVRVEVDRVLSEFDQRFSLTTVVNTADRVREQSAELLVEFRSTILLVMACLYVFLGLRQALISSLTVPLTFLATFIFMRYTGMSINFLSLFALLIALGLLVDDTIVTVQAMTTYYKTGKFTPYETGLIVWRDLIVPIWSTTITTIWSFAPLLLSTGIIGEFIKPIPIVVTITMISSTAIATLFTLPLMVVLLKLQVPHRVKVLGKVLGLIIVVGVFMALLRGNVLMIPATLLFLGALWILKLSGRTLITSIKSWMSHRIGVPSEKHAAWFSYARHTLNHGIIDLEGMSASYGRLIRRVLASPSARKKVIVGIVIYAICSFLLLPLGFVKNEFFPKAEADTIYVSLEMPSGTDTAILDAQARTLLEVFRKTKDSLFTVADIGQGLSEMGGMSETPNTVLFTIHLKEEGKRQTSSIALSESIREHYARYTGGKISVIEESSGPPAGSDLQMKLVGDDLAVLDRYADTLVSYLKTQPGVTNVNKSIKPGPSKLVFIPDQELLAQYGVTSDSIGLSLRSFVSGFTLGDLDLDKTGGDKTDIVFGISGWNTSPESLGAVTVGTPKGDQVSLHALGTIVAKSNPTSITREGGKRTISVSAGVRPGFSISDKNTELTKFADTIGLPEGYAWKTGGVNEENQKSVNSILQAMGLAFLLILVTMVVQFQSYRQALLVLLVIPLAVSSVFVIFSITGTPLSFPALIGVLSLFGIVVTNSMFIVDKINMNIKQGMEFVDAIADAGSSRLEPILLTKLCTVFGLLPITLSDPLWQGLGGAVISGLLIASTIMLLFIPVVYYEWFKGEVKQ